MSVGSGLLVDLGNESLLLGFHLLLSGCVGDSDNLCSDRLELGGKSFDLSLKGSKNASDSSDLGLMPSDCESDGFVLVNEGLDTLGKINSLVVGFLCVSGNFSRNLRLTPWKIPRRDVAWLWLIIIIVSSTNQDGTSSETIAAR